MDTSEHDLIGLFRQLGLDSSTSGIVQFTRTHHLGQFERIDRAGFWNSSQSGFLRQSWEEDSDWVGIVDQLDNLLRHDIAV